MPYSFLMLLYIYQCVTRGWRENGGEGNPRQLYGHVTILIIHSRSVRSIDMKTDNCLWYQIFKNMYMFFKYIFVQFFGFFLINEMTRRVFIDNKIHKLYLKCKYDPYFYVSCIIFTSLNNFILHIKCLMGLYKIVNTFKNTIKNNDGMIGIFYLVVLF